MPDLLILGVPSRDGLGLMASVLALSGLSQVLDRPVAVVQGEGGNIPKARNQVVALIRARLGPEPRSTLWWDTDILVTEEQIPAVADMVRYGESHQACVTADYRMNAVQSHLMRGDRTPGAGTHYTPEELAAMPEWSPVGMAGFGLLFIPSMPLDYVFHADTIGEDTHWWWDHPDIPLVRAQHVTVGHRKSVWL